MKNVYFAIEYLDPSFMLYVALSFRLADVYCAILILHDHDDEIISFELGKKVIVRMLIPFSLNLHLTTFRF